MWKEVGRKGIRTGNRELTLQTMQNKSREFEEVEKLSGTLDKNKHVDGVSFDGDRDLDVEIQAKDLVIKLLD